jgi:hypothetical protein
MWQRMGTKDYHWAMIEITPDDTPGGHDDGHAFLLLRRHRYTGTISYYLCWSPQPVPLAKLIDVAVARWKIEMVFTQLAKRAVRTVGGGREHVADLDLAVGDDHPVDEQFSQQPALTSPYPALHATSTSASIIRWANSRIIARSTSGLADARVSSNCTPGTGTMSPAATSLSFVAPKPLRRIARWPPRITATRRTPATQSPQYRLPHTPLPWT